MQQATYKGYVLWGDAIDADVDITRTARELRLCS